MQLSDLDINKTYTYAGYLQWTFDERLELIKGKIFEMSPAPGSVHQIVSGDGRFLASRILTISDEVTTPTLPGLTINLEELFADQLQ